MWLNLVFFIAFCGQAISESPGLKTIYMISVFISVYMLCCTWNIPGWFPTGVGSLIPAAYVKGCPVKCSPPAAVWTSRRAKAMNKVGVCDWLPLYYHAGMYRVPFCYIAVNCDKERLDYLRNLGSRDAPIWSAPINIGRYSHYRFWSASSKRPIKHGRSDDIKSARTTIRDVSIKR